MHVWSYLCPAGSLWASRSFTRLKLNGIFRFGLFTTSCNAFPRTCSFQVCVMGDRIKSRKETFTCYVEIKIRIYNTSNVCIGAQKKQRRWPHGSRWTPATSFGSGRLMTHRLPVSSRHPHWILSTWRSTPCWFAKCSAQVRRSDEVLLRRCSRGIESRLLQVWLDVIWWPDRPVLHPACHLPYLWPIDWTNKSENLIFPTGFSNKLRNARAVNSNVRDFRFLQLN